MTADEWVARVGPSDAARRHASGFLGRLGQTSLFTSDRDILVARAPGRLDVIGGIADYRDRSFSSGRSPTPRSSPFSAIAIRPS